MRGLCWEPRQSVLLKMWLVPWLSQLTLESPLVAVVAALRTAYLNEMLTYGLQPEEGQLEAYNNALRAVATLVVSSWESVRDHVMGGIVKVAIEQEVSKIYRRHGGCRVEKLHARHLAPVGMTVSLLWLAVDR